MSSISLVYQYQLGENVNPPAWDLQSPRIIVKLEEEGDSNIYATSKCQGSLENSLSDGNDKPFLLQITYLLKHVRGCGKELTQDAFSLGNFKFSEGGKELVWEIRSSFIKNANNDGKSETLELANLFGNIFEKAKVQSKESCHLLKKMRSDDCTVDEVLRHPYFWSSMKIVNFLCSIFHITKSLGRKTPWALKKALGDRDFGKSLGWKKPEGLKKALGDKDFQSWKSKLQADIPEDESYDPDSVTNILSEYTYGESLSELLRFIRNIARHYWDNGKEHNAAVRDVFGSEYDGLWRFFNKKFPKLLILLYDCLPKNGDVTEMLRPYLDELAPIKNIA